MGIRLFEVDNGTDNEFVFNPEYVRSVEQMDATTSVITFSNGDTITVQEEFKQLVLRLTHSSKS